MEVLHCPDNIKVHFAGAEVQNQFEAARVLGVKYGLYTAFPFVERMIFGKESKSPLIPLKWQKENPFDLIPQYITKTMRHCIQDSGLFTLMFGACKGKADESMINKWYDGLVQFTLDHSPNVTCVEVDCQKILGIDKAWEFRERIKNDLKGHRIINVFHLEDGQKGLDRLIEYAEYIAISVPELRVHHKKDYVIRLANYIKTKKPSIDIHLLGCTENSILKECRFCTSADSTSWVSGKRFGFLKGYHISRLKTDEVKRMVGNDKWKYIYEIPNNETNTNYLCSSIEILKNEYQKSCGNQDYYK